RSHPACLQLPLPARAPPFPYTTLFRSSGTEQIPGAAGSLQLLPLLGAGEHADHDPLLSHPASIRHEVVLDNFGPPPFQRSAPPGDRKSTRLNSSHVSISYPVFCLQKNT